MCKYLNPETLKREDGTVEEYFIIPLRDPRRSLLVKAEGEEKNRRVWNEQTQQEEEL